MKKEVKKLLQFLVEREIVTEEAVTAYKRMAKSSGSSNFSEKELLQALQVNACLAYLATAETTNKDTKQ